MISKWKSRFCVAVTVGLIAGTVVTGRTASAQTWTYDVYSSDRGARATWTYDASAGIVLGTLRDLTMFDGQCAVMWVRGFTSALGWSKRQGLQICDGKTASVRFTLDRRDSIFGQVCTGGGSCATTKPQVGCTDDYPLQAKLIARSTEIQKHVDRVVLCTNLTRSQTKVTNNSEVAWTIQWKQGSGSPVVTYSQSQFAQQFVYWNPGGGSQPLLLPKASAVVSASPGLLLFVVDHGKTMSFEGTKLLFENVVSFGQDQLTAALTRGSLWSGAISECAWALWDVYKLSDTSVSATDLPELVFDVAGPSARGVKCAKKVVQAADAADRQWTHTVASLEEIVGLFEKVDKVAEVNRVWKIVELFEDLPPIHI